MAQTAPGQPTAARYYRLGLSATSQGDIAAAQQFLEKALRLAPWMADAQEALWALPEKAPARAAEKSPRAIAHAKDS
jgi:Tfp pilus assembly protein PilF